MRKLLGLFFLVCVSAQAAEGKVIEFTFYETLDCNGPIYSYQNFPLPDSMSMYSGALSVRTLGYMSISNDTNQTLYTNFSSHLSVRAKLLTRWAFDDLVIINDFNHFTDSLAPGQTHFEDISRDLTAESNAITLSEADQADLGVLGRMQIDGECLDWFVTQNGVQDSAHQFVEIKVRLFYRE